MTKEETIMFLAKLTVNEYAWFVHAGAVSFLIGARINRNSWFSLLLIGATLLFIAVVGYSSAQLVLPAVPQASQVSHQLIMFQQILLLAYGAVGAGLVTVALTMPKPKDD